MSTLRAFASAVVLHIAMLAKSPWYGLGQIEDLAVEKDVDNEVSQELLNCSKWSVVGV